MTRSGLDGRERTPAPGGASASPRGRRTGWYRLGWTIAYAVLAVVLAVAIVALLVAGRLLWNAAAWAVGG